MTPGHERGRPAPQLDGRDLTTNQHESNPRARIEVTDTDVRVIAKFSPDLRDGLRTLGAHWVPGHWSVPAEHMAETIEIVTDALGAPSVADLRRPGQ